MVEADELLRDGAPACALAESDDPRSDAMPHPRRAADVQPGGQTDGTLRGAARCALHPNQVVLIGVVFRLITCVCVPRWHPSGALTHKMCICICRCSLHVHCARPAGGLGTLTLTLTLNFNPKPNPNPSPNPKTLPTDH